MTWGSSVISVDALHTTLALMHCVALYRWHKLLHSMSASKHQHSGLTFSLMDEWIICQEKFQHFFLPMSSKYVCGIYIAYITSYKPSRPWHKSVPHRCMVYDHTLFFWTINNNDRCSFLTHTQQGSWHKYLVMLDTSLSILVCLENPRVHLIMFEGKSTWGVYTVLSCRQRRSLPPV